jgi:aerotaxis receptor
MQYNNSEFLIETQVPFEELIVSRTNLKGEITYANEAFADISGYTVDELIGKPHNIVRHPDMPKAVFKQMWQTIKEYKKWSGYIKNMRKDGGFYWVKAEVSGIFKDHVLCEYKSTRTPISYEEKLQAQKEYDAMKEVQGELKRYVTYE